MNLFQILKDNTLSSSVLKELSLKRKVTLGKVLDGFFPFLCVLLQENLQTPVIALFSQNDSLERVYSLLKGLNLPVFRFPALESYLGEKVASDPTWRAERISTLWNLSQVKNPIVLTTVKAFLQSTPSPHFLRSFQLFLKKGNKYTWSSLLDFLAKAGYQRVSKVEQLGEFSVRGGIIDVFSPSLELPYRLEFLDEQLESIRIFDPESQASLEERKEATILPWRLFPINQDDLHLLEVSFQRQLQALKKTGKISESHFLEENFYRDFQYLKNGQFFPEEDFYFSFFSRSSYLWEHFWGERVVISEEEGRIEHSFEEFVKSSEKIHREAVQRGEQVPLREPFPEWAEFKNKLEENRVVYCTPFNAPLELPLEAPPSLPQYPDLSSKLKFWLSQKTVVVFAGKGAKRYCESLESEGLSLTEINSLWHELPDQSVFIWDLPLSSGFTHSQSKYVFLSDFELFGWKGKAYIEKKYRQAKPVSSYEEIQEGDYVVHQAYGVGIYQGLETLTIDGVSRDYLKIAYAGEDRLFIPVDQIYLIQKYVGDSVKIPPLTRLNTTDWAKIKKRVQESVERLAQELLQVYAIREVNYPEPYPPLEPWETELAQSFPFEETPGQKQAIQDTLCDLERGKWMDRLVCGDVGYGKTEVAIRAAFRTVASGKQVAILVPTTILCQQHYNTFLERLRGFPVKLGVLSRFRSPKEQAQVVRGLKEGKIDIVIGTHRLLSSDVEFKNLGLLVIDEEHRFGVLQKEQIRKLKGTVHVLSLSATPIPRTMQMSLMGIKETSIIETPPQNRYPVKTYVTEFSEDLIRRAILYELDRGGQVYFVHNRIHALPRLHEKLKGLVPEARIAVAHGAMNEERLEQVMWDFAQGAYDVLLCTTIIESGIDIPRANTLIVADAHNLGLAQLYQLRGRVGRSNLRAYAYFLYPKSRALSEEAEKRLETIRDFAHLGSGLKIALRDLEIRGAGNLLGKEQHGFMLQVGFQMYRQMLEEAIERVKKGEELPPPEKERSLIELGINAFIPSAYMDEENKIEFYERLTALNSREKLERLKAEMKDRFGPFPEPCSLLFQAVEARILAEKLGIRRVVKEGNLVVFYWKGELPFEPERFLKLSETFPRRLKIKENYFYLRLEEKSDREVLDFVLKVLHTLEKEINA